MPTGTRSFNAINGNELKAIILKELTQELSLDPRFKSEAPCPKLTMAFRLRVDAYPMDTGPFTVQVTTAFMSDVAAWNKMLTSRMREDDRGRGEARARSGRTLQPAPDVSAGDVGLAARSGSAGGAREDCARGGTSRDGPQDRLHGAGRVIGHPDASSQLPGSLRHGREWLT